MSLLMLTDGVMFPQGTSVCLGMFDGVHLGHARLIRTTVESAQMHHLTPCAFTFDVPPAAVLRPDKNIRLLTDIHQKSDLMHQLGLSHVVYAHFDKAVSDLPAESFFRDILLQRLNARHIVVGFHYRFGRHALGDEKLLKSLCAQHGIQLTVIPPVTLDDGTLISSTAIRQALENHNLPLAARMLGRPVSESL